ncbi:MAG TPA: STAS/SEC14 domain-containing protein [Bacteroidia bacterium]|jgi:hypothetical protein|nr:STAS/SEC14 domain-containing protein [Bacteroidia bacterium]
MKSTEIKTKTCLVSKDDFGIIHKTVRPNSHLSAEDIRESDEIGFKLSDGKKALILYDARPAFTLTNDAMEYLHKHLLSKRRIASAIVSDQPGIKVLGDYFKYRQQGKAQVKVFSTMREALEWLLSFKYKKAAELLKGKELEKQKPKEKTLKKVKGDKAPAEGVLTTCIARVDVHENNIAFKRVLPNTHIDLSSLKQSVKDTIEFLGPEKRKMVYDLRPHFTITDDALNFVIDEVMGKHGIATAVIAKTIGVYLMADYAVKIKKIKTPLKVFTDEEAALKWLAKHKN